MPAARRGEAGAGPRGQLLPEMHEILDIAKANDMVVATGAGDRFALEQAEAHVLVGQVDVAVAVGDW